MPLDPRTGVFYALHGQGRPLMITLPLMASFESIFGGELAAVLHGYLQPLTDRYRVLLVDYPSIGGSRDIPPQELTMARVAEDLFGVASAAGFDRFAYWGYSWGAAVGLQLASHAEQRQRLTALAIGGWPPLAAPYAAILEAARRKRVDPEPSSMKVLRNKAQYAQWIHCYESLQGWNEREAVARIACPRLVYFGAEGDLVEAGIPVPIASSIRQQRGGLTAAGWAVHEIAEQAHGVCMLPALVVPPVAAFLDTALG